MSRIAVKVKARWRVSPRGRQAGAVPGRSRWRVDHAREGLFLHALQPAGSDHAGQRDATHPVWTFSTGVLAGHEGQPLVVKNTMYVVTPWPNMLYAFDLTQEGYPLKWKYRPDVSPNAIGDVLL